MSFAGALEVLRPTLPYYVALTKYGLLRITKDRYEFHPHPAAPPIALEMAKAVFTMGASSCTESYIMSRTLGDGPKVFTFDALTCEALAGPHPRRTTPRKVGCRSGIGEDEPLAGQACHGKKPLVGNDPGHNLVWKVQVRVTSLVMKPTRAVYFSSQVFSESSRKVQARVTSTTY
jgi:hypothetical protein